MPWLRICGPTVVVMAGEEGAQLRSENRYELSILLCIAVCPESCCGLESPGLLCVLVT